MQLCTVRIGRTMTVKKCSCFDSLALWLLGGSVCAVAHTVVLHAMSKDQWTNAQSNSVRLSGVDHRLTANATYRYINQCVLSSDLSTANGSGNCIFASPSGSFVRTSSPASLPGGRTACFHGCIGQLRRMVNHGTNGECPVRSGGNVFMRIMLNDGGLERLLQKAHHADSVHVVKLNPAAADSAGTGLRCTSTMSSKDFVFVYDDTAATGRPTVWIVHRGRWNSQYDRKQLCAFYGTSVNGSMAHLVWSCRCAAEWRAADRTAIARRRSAGFIGNGRRRIWPSGRTRSILWGHDRNSDGGDRSRCLHSHGECNAWLVIRQPDQRSYQHERMFKSRQFPTSVTTLWQWTGECPGSRDGESPHSRDGHEPGDHGFHCSNTSVPTLIAPAFSGVTSTTAILGATMLDGNSPINERGVVWSTSASPTTSGNKWSHLILRGIYRHCQHPASGTLIYFRAMRSMERERAIHLMERLYALHEPSAQAGSFHATAVSASQINLHGVLPQVRPDTCSSTPRFRSDGSAA